MSSSVPHRAIKDPATYKSIEDLRAALGRLTQDLAALEAQVTDDIAAITTEPSDGDKGDITVSGSGLTWAIDNNSVTFAKQADLASDRLVGRDTAGSGDPEALTVGGGLEFTGSGGIQRSALTGDVTAAAGAGATTIANDAVTNAKLANMAQSTIKGRVTSGTGDPEDLTAAQVLSILGSFGAGYFGTGLDGALTVAAGTTTLTQEGDYTTVVVQSGGILETAGWAVRATTSITVDSGGTIRCNGNSSTTSGGATGGGGSNRTYAQGTTGGNSAVEAGAAGTNATNQPKNLPNTGATSGVGGAGGLGAGGAGGAAGTKSTTTDPRSATVLPYILEGRYPGGTTQFPAGTGGGGGGGNGVANANSGGGGGGGIVGLAAPTITNSGAIEARGGNSANAGNNNCGTGGGGGGGYVVLVCRSFSGNTPDVSGGIGGTPQGTGVQGSTGSTGKVFTITGV